MRLYEWLDIAAMEADDLKVGFDGCTYAIDVNLGGLSKTIVRWCPDDSRIKDLFQFAASCCYEYAAR